MFVIYARFDMRSIFRWECVIRINNQVEKQFASAMDELGDLSKLKEKADKVIRKVALV